MVFAFVYYSTVSQQLARVFRHTAWLCAFFIAETPPVVAKRIGKRGLLRVLFFYGTLFLFSCFYIVCQIAGDLCLEV